MAMCVLLGELVLPEECIKEVLPETPRSGYNPATFCWRCHRTAKFKRICPARAAMRPAARGFASTASTRRFASVTRVSSRRATSASTRGESSAVLTAASTGPYASMANSSATALVSSASGRRLRRRWRRLRSRRRRQCARPRDARSSSVARGQWARCERHSLSTCTCIGVHRSSTPPPYSIP